MRMDITRASQGGIAAMCREAVERGEDDQPVEVWIDGKHCLNIRGLHSFALMMVIEDPSPRFVAWAPHPMATVGPRVQALLNARAERRAINARARGR